MIDAEGYLEKCDLTERDADQILSEFLGPMKWKPKERVLDLGCGPGSITANILLPRLPSDVEILVGADISHPMLQVASSKYMHPKLKFQYIDLSEDIPADSDFRTPGFDKIFSFYCLHWIYDQRLVTTNIYNMLRPGGEAVLSFIARSSIVGALVNQSRKSEWRPYVKDVEQVMGPYQHSPNPAKEYKEILTDVGFNVVDCRLRKISYDFESSGIMKDFYSTVNPFYPLVPKELRDSYLTDVMMEMTKYKYTKQTIDTDSKVTQVMFEQIDTYVRKL